MMRNGMRLLSAWKRMEESGEGEGEGVICTGTGYEPERASWAEQQILLLISQEEEDYYREILGLLHGSDLADGVPSIETTPEADANPSCLVQENEVEMICNSLPMAESENM
ncbi:hypothetical protein DKX38_007466 [Salix brachista]|uniref:Uncharacterized protein n=1 Tax=Salix brachista TaxID=2182728 RepID=A0A5N5MNJ6_9ROSI|nr:hypothetical protein DKX38_007466 [Salix brachista]